MSWPFQIAGHESEDWDGALFSRHGVNIQHEPDTYRKLSLVILFSLLVVMFLETISVYSF